MHVVFINYAGYIGCSGVHIHFLAQTLTQMGIRCSVYIALSKGSKNYFGKSIYPIFDYSKVIEHTKSGYFKNCILHAWTPREASRQVTSYITHNNKHIPYFVHLEDNECALLEHYFKKPLSQLQKEALEYPDRFTNSSFCHPLYFQNFMNSATGVTCIIKKLEEHIPQNIPRMTFWPACEGTFFQLPQKTPQEQHQLFGIPLNTKVIVYPGNIHKHNKKDIENLFTALDIINKQGYPVMLIRCGINTIPLSEVASPEQLQYIVDVGHPQSHNLPYYISLADILIQPGHLGDFDDYRFPSKIPLFLASGRPVILPKTNIGLSMEHGKNCFLLQTGSAEEIAMYIAILIKNPEQAETMGKQGKKFAQESFSWNNSAQKLIDFYRDCLSHKNLHNT